MWSNPIGDKGAQYLAEALKVNQTIKYLSSSLSELTDCKIGSKGICDIADALLQNKAIIQIRIDHCRLRSKYH